MFNSSNFDDEDVKYLNFSDDFNISLTNKIKIILGPNGTGKTSIYKNIKRRFYNYSFIDYADVEQSVIARKNEIIIGPSILLLEQYQNEKNDLINIIDIKNNLKQFNITNKATSDKISNKLDSLRKNPKAAVEKFSGKNLKCIFNMNDDYKDFFKNNAKQLIEIEEIRTDVETIRDNYKKHFLEEIDKFLEDNDYICPVCGQKNNETIKSIIGRKLSDIKEIQEEIVKNYQELHTDLGANKVLENIKELQKIVADNNVTIDDLEDYLLCGGDEKKAELILKIKGNLKKIDKNIKKLETKKNKFYQNLKIYKGTLLSTFQLQFDVLPNQITFDDENKLIQIELPRKIEEYSTGEINLMTFIICILEFISSDKENLIIDDPLSSYDLPNQYKIMYEIATAKSNLKNILIFTHNIDTINIANSQYSGIFEYEILEKANCKLYLNKINIDTSQNVLSVKELLKLIPSNYSHTKYIKLLMEKENFNDSIPDEFENHLIFHYDEPFSKEIDGTEYSNDYIANLINNFDINTLQNLSYVENTANKIIYTASLRIWIEKQFYNNSPDDISLHRRQFGQKIKYIFNSHRWHGSQNVTKEYLMSKKVMLNQHIHTNSQIEPFYYALNLSLDDITKEIIDIKEHFKID